MSLNHIRRRSICEADFEGRKQPWSTYAVYQTTIIQWALFWDCLLIHSYHTSTASWSANSRTTGLMLLLAWMLLSKFLKLLGHYIRYPVDFLLLPVSILFGYIHGLIKARAMLSLNVVWGSFLVSGHHLGHRSQSYANHVFSEDSLGYTRRCGRRRCLSHDPGPSKASRSRQSRRK